MKVKLLKKIRKRFSIIRIDEIASDVDNATKKCEKEMGLPFYQIIDNNHDDMIFKIYRYNKYYEDAYNKLHEIILDNYAEKFRHVDQKRY